VGETECLRQLSRYPAGMSHQSEMSEVPTNGGRLVGKKGSTRAQRQRSHPLKPGQVAKGSRLAGATPSPWLIRDDIRTIDPAASERDWRGWVPPPSAARPIGIRGTLS
jgi:hypothetical protein